jgi:phage gp36-like protein
VTLYASRASLIRALSQDAQAQLSNDPLRRARLGRADGTKARFEAPFAESTALKVFIDGEEVADGWALSSGTGAEEADEVVFEVAPTAGMVSASADKRAINLTVIDGALRSASATIARYVPENISAEDLVLLEPICITLAKVALRGRRELGVYEALDLEYKTALRWLEGVKKGDFSFGRVSETTEPDEVEALSGSEPAVFGPVNHPESNW